MQMGWGKGLIVGGLIGLCLLPEIGWGQAPAPAATPTPAAPAAPPGAQGKPRGCLTTKEHTAEQLVRHGVRLRETTFRCDKEYPQKTPMFPRWETFYKASEAQFAQQVTTRQQGFAREFPKNPQEMTQYWDDRLVVHLRYYPLTAPYCQGIDTQLGAIDKSGWKTFAKQAATARTEIMLWDYKLCR